MIHYHAECTDPLYQKFTSNKIRVYIFCYKLDLTIACFLILTIAHLLIIAPDNATVSLPKMGRYGIPDPIWQQIGRKTLKTTTKLGVIPLTESQQ